MKIYKEKPNEYKKSWCIRNIVDAAGDVATIACDCASGEEIAFLLVWETCGEVVRIVNAKLSIEGRGYDPHEHENKFDAKGAIIIE